MRVFRVSREENHEANMVVYLAMLRTTETVMNIFVEVVKALCTENVMVSAIKERKD